MKKKSWLSNITQLEYKVNVKHEYKVELKSLQMIFYIEVIISCPTSEAELFAFNITQAFLKHERKEDVTNDYIIPLL